MDRMAHEPLTTRAGDYSPRDCYRLADEFATQFRRVATGYGVSGIWKESSDRAGERVGLGSTPERCIRVDTAAPIWPALPLDRRLMMQRDLTAGTTTAGGFLVATDNISFVDMLRNRMVAFAMGARRLSGLVGNITIPKLTGSATAYWLATEATAITESQQSFGQLALTPRTVGAVAQISRLLQLQSSPQALGLVMSDLAAVVARAADLAVIAGTGGSQPTGIINTANIGSVSGTNIAAAGVIEFQSDVAANNALTPSCGYVTTASVASLLKARPELPTTGTTPMWQGSLLDGSLYGFRAMTSAQCPAGYMIFGDWSSIVFGEWGVLELAVSESANAGDFQTGISTVRAMYTCDVGLRYPGAFSVSTNVS